MALIDAVFAFYLLYCMHIYRLSYNLVALCHGSLSSSCPRVCVRVDRLLKPLCDNQSILLLAPPIHSVRGGVQPRRGGRGHRAPSGSPQNRRAALQTAGGLPRHPALQNTRPGRWKSAHKKTALTHKGARRSRAPERGGGAERRRRLICL